MASSRGTCLNDTNFNHNKFPPHQQTPVHAFFSALHPPTAMCDEVFQSNDADPFHAAPMPPAYTPHVLDARPSRPLASSSTATATSVRVGRELPRPGNTVAETMNMLRAQLSTSRANMAALQSEMAESRSAYDADRMVWQADMDGVYNELASARSDLHQSATHGLALIQANADLSAQVELLTHRLDSLSEVYMQDAVKSNCNRSLTPDQWARSAHGQEQGRRA